MRDPRVRKILGSGLYTHWYKGISTSPALQRYVQQRQHLCIQCIIGSMRYRGTSLTVSMSMKLEQMTVEMSGKQMGGRLSTDPIERLQLTLSSSIYFDCIDKVGHGRNSSNQFSHIVGLNPLILFKCYFCVRFYPTPRAANCTNPAPSGASYGLQV